MKNYMKIKWKKTNLTHIENTNLSRRDNSGLTMGRYVGRREPMGYTFLEREAICSFSRLPDSFIDSIIACGVIFFHSLASCALILWSSCINFGSFACILFFILYLFTGSYSFALGRVGGLRRCRKLVEKAYELEIIMNPGIQFFVGSDKAQPQFFGSSKVYCVINDYRVSGGKFYGQHN